MRSSKCRNWSLRTGLGTVYNIPSSNSSSAAIVSVYLIDTITNFFQILLALLHSIALLRPLSIRNLYKTTKCRIFNTFIAVGVFIFIILWGFPSTFCVSYKIEPCDKLLRCSSICFILMPTSQSILVDDRWLMIKMCTWKRLWLALTSRYRRLSEGRTIELSPTRNDWWNQSSVLILFVQHLSLSLLVVNLLKTLKLIDLLLMMKESVILKRRLQW